MSEPRSSNPAETYERYLGRAIADPWTRVLLEYAAPQPGERALHLACGAGSVARHVASLVGAEGKVVALDINPDMLAVGSALPAPADATIEWRRGDVSREVEAVAQRYRDGDKLTFPMSTHIGVAHVPRTPQFEEGNRRWPRR
jgi:SAM-dependent methyltransferase